MQPQAAKENLINVRWLPELLDHLREQVLVQLNPEEPPRECGGLLLGSVQRNGERVHIIVRQFVPISCSYQEEQFYRLSLQQSILRCVSAHWSCIGLYRSHSRPGLELDEGDLQVAREHLKDPPSIFLLVSANGQQGGLFFFDGREFSRDRSFSELPRIPSSEGSPAYFSALDHRVAAGFAELAGQFSAFAKSAIRTAAHHCRSIASLTPRRMPGWLACSLIVLIVGFIMMWSVWEWPVPSSGGERTSSTQSQSGLGLASSMEFDHVRIAWNPQAPSVAGASHGTLLITDGQARNKIPLDKDALAQGSVVYRPKSAVASVELRIGDVTESLVAAGLDGLVNATPTPALADARELVPPPAEHTPRPQNSRHPLDPRLLTLASDPGPERTRAKYAPPPSFRPAIPAPEVLQPPELGIAVNPTYAEVARLPMNIPPPPAPQQNRPESAEPVLSGHVDFVAAQTIKHVSPQTSGNALRLLVANVTIQVQVHINSQGRVVRADSLSHGGTLVEYLSHLSVNAAREWLFAPARREGRDVASDTVLEFVFDNKGTESSP